MSFSSQPGFGQHATSSAETSTHQPNEPDVQPDNVIIRALSDIKGRLGNIEKSMGNIQHELTHVRTLADARYKDLLHDKAIAYNKFAKDKNENTDGAWTILHDLNTNEPIPGFPENIGELQGLGDAQIVPMLQALGYDASNFSMHEKMNVLRSNISG